jgi:eukaryotic translation initiation factor 2C
MAPNLRYPFNVRSFFTPSETSNIGGGIVLWRGYFQSVRPAIGRMLINVDISTGAMYLPGPLIQVALAFLGFGPDRQDALVPRKRDNRGLPDRERIRLQRFLANVKITTSHGQPGRQGPKPRVVKKLSKDGAKELTFELGNGQQTTVADYFRGVLGRPLRYPDVICVEVCASSTPACSLIYCHAALKRCSNPAGAMRDSTRTNNA